MEKLLRSSFKIAYYLGYPTAYLMVFLTRFSTSFTRKISFALLITTLVSSVIVLKLKVDIPSYLIPILAMSLVGTLAHLDELELKNKTIKEYGIYLNVKQQKLLQKISLKSLKTSIILFIIEWSIFIYKVYVTNSMTTNQWYYFTWIIGITSITTITSALLYRAWNGLPLNHT